jgi:hypothetical protein
MITDLDLQKLEGSEEAVSLAMAEAFRAAQEVAAMKPTTDADRARQVHALAALAAARVWGRRFTYPASRLLSSPRKQRRQCELRFEEDPQLPLLVA